MNYIQATKLSAAFPKGQRAFLVLLITLLFFVFSLTVDAQSLNRSDQKTPTNATDQAGDQEGSKRSVTPQWKRFHQVRGHKPWAAFRAIDWGLDWLARQQQPGGYWVSQGKAWSDVGVTGLALLAFLGADYQPDKGDYSLVLEQGLRYLMKQQDPATGCLASKAAGTGSYLNHAIACLALCEAYGQSNWPPLEKPSNQALNYVVACRSPGHAWSSSSETTWSILCLATGSKFSGPLDRQIFSDVLAYVTELENIRKNDRDSDLGRVLTSEIMLCRLFCGKVLNNQEELKPLLEKGAKQLRDNPPTWAPKSGSIDFAHWFHGSLVMWHMGGVSLKIWRDALYRALLDGNQCSDGPDKGTWDPSLDHIEAMGGRVCSTAFSLLSLEIRWLYNGLLVMRQR